MQTSATNHSGMTLAELDWWAWLLGLVAIALTVGAAIVGAFAFHFASRRDAAKDAETARVAFDLEKQKGETAKAQRDVLELRQKVQWRTLTSSERDALRDALKAASAKGPVTLFTRDSRDEESNEYADEIASVLAESGWRYGPMGGSNDLVPRHPVGLSIRVADPRNPPAHGIALKAALDAALGVSVPITKTHRAGNGKDAVMLVIHPKRL